MEDAILDTPSDAIEPVSTSTEPESPLPSDTGGDDPIADPAEGEAVPPAAAPTAPKQFVIDGKKLSADAHKTLTEMQATNPALARGLRDALFQSDAIQREFGGIQGVRETFRTVQELGGVDGIRATVAEHRQLSQLDQQFTSADPAFIKAMVQSPEGQSAFVRLAPEMMATYAGVNPQGFSAYFANVMLADMEKNRFSSNMELLENFIATENPKALEILGRLKQYGDRLTGMAQKPMTPEQPKAADDGRAKELDEREMNLRRQEYHGVIAESRKSLFDQNYAELSKDRKLNDIQKAAVFELASAKLSAALRTNGYNEALEKFFKAKDKDGYTRHNLSVLKAEIPKALKAAMDTYGPAPGKPGPKPGQQAAAPRPGDPTAPAGFQLISTMPRADQIDRVASNGLIAQHKAVLTDGRKVYWRV